MFGNKFSNLNPYELYCVTNIVFEYTFSLTWHTFKGLEYCVISHDQVTHDTYMSLWHGNDIDISL